MNYHKTLDVIIEHLNQVILNYTTSLTYVYNYSIKWYKMASKPTGIQKER